MKYKLILSYDGSCYAGWQTQKNVSTIQECLEKGLSQITQENISITGSGRTDAGVHAKGQVCHFDSKAPHLSLTSINGVLPKDIRVFSIEVVPNHFHARFSAKEKVYSYHVTTSQIQDPFKKNYTLHYTYRLDLKKIVDTIPYFLGEKDFSSFANELSPLKNPIKTLYAINLIESETGFILQFRGNGFLYKMVRNITGTLLDIGRGKLEPSAVPTIFAAKSRSFAGNTAPPHALFLEQVLY